MEEPHWFGEVKELGDKFARWEVEQVQRELLAKTQLKRNEEALNKSLKDNEVLKEKIDKLEKELDELRTELRIQTNKEPQTCILSHNQSDRTGATTEVSASPESLTDTPPTSSTPSHTPHHNSTRSQEQVSAEIALLIDSNGRYLDEKRLFPHHSVKKHRCQNTRRAIELLSEERLGCPSHIIIHTGTNNLRTQTGEDVAREMKKVVDKATSTFPRSKVIISALLPRWDFPPSFMQRLNAQISRDCALRENVFLAVHPTLDQHSLFDTVHIFKERVPDFAKTLKDVALNRRPTATRKSNTGTNPSPRGSAASGSSIRRYAAPPRAPQATTTPLPPLYPPHQHNTNTQATSLQATPPQPTPLFSKPGLLPAPIMPTSTLLTTYRGLTAPNRQPIAPHIESTAPHKGPTLAHRGPAHRGPLPGSDSYAQVVSRAPAPAHQTPTSNEMRNIEEMLTMLCQHLIA